MYMFIVQIQYPISRYILAPLELAPQISGGSEYTHCVHYVTRQKGTWGKWGTLCEQQFCYPLVDLNITNSLWPG